MSWHKQDIKAAIYKRGYTMAQLARENQLSESTVRDALNRPITSGELVISRFLNIPLHELWSMRWTNNGQRIRPRYADKHSTQKRGIAQ